MTTTRPAWAYTLPAALLLMAPFDILASLAIPSHAFDTVRESWARRDPSLYGRLDLAYDGAAFHGWAKQPGLRTVQGKLEDGLARVAGTEVATVVAGRTDAGVHATGQVAHVDLGRDWRPDTVRDALNAHLSQAGERVAIVAVSAVTAWRASGSSRRKGCPASCNPASSTGSTRRSRRFGRTTARPAAS